MFRRTRRSSPPEDPSVAAIEQILTIAASREFGSAVTPEGEDVVIHALSICACVTAWNAPTWLIYDAASGTVSWRRVPDGIDALGLVQARRSAGGHADPEAVLNWLQGDATAPWGPGGDGSGDGSGDLTVLPELLRKIRGTGGNETVA
ncbi:MAG: hypothetical protein ACRCYU_22065 [Nocardioides sp.]